MLVTIRHTSSTGPEQLELDQLPLVGDEIEHHKHGRSIVNFVYTDVTPPVIVLVLPRGSVYGWRKDRYGVWQRDREPW